MASPAAGAVNRDLATVELLGALCYGQLRAFEAAARLVRFAPDVDRGARVAELAIVEHGAYAQVAAELHHRTELASSVIDRQKPRFDAYFDALELDDWFSGVVYLATGLPIAADFARAVAPTVDERAAEAVLATADTRPLERFAFSELEGMLDDDSIAMSRARHLVAQVTGQALTGVQGVLGDTDALRVLFERHAQQQGESPERVVKRMLIDVLEAHRRRMLPLGLDEL